MKKQQKPSASTPRQVREFLVTPAVVERRKPSKQKIGTASPSLFAVSASDGLVANEVVHAPAVAAGRSAAASEHRPDATAGGVLFQYYGHCCDKRKDDEGTVNDSPIYGPEDLGKSVGREYRVRPCRCRKWFCPGCGPRMGYKLQQKLLVRLRTFTAVYGITLTVDGSLFATPEDAWRYVMENRLLARLMRDLGRRNYLYTKAYFWVVEFQQNTEQPHWHLLLDAKFVPYGEIVEIWSRFRPASAPKLAQRITAENYKGHAPAFGSVHFSPAMTDPEKACYYTTKYLTKYPSYGYPNWVLDRVGRMPRYNHSKGFFPKASNHDVMCFCAECRGDEKPKSTKTSPKTSTTRTNKKPAALTIRQRLQQCGNRCTIFQVEQIRLPDGAIVDGKARFNGQLNLSFQEACEYLGYSAEHLWQIAVTGTQAIELEELALQVPLTERAS